jgi:Fe-S cluster assembly protein SufD
MSTITLNKKTLLSLQNDTVINAAARLEELGLPTKKTEAYRYFDIEPLLQKQYKKPIVEKKEIQEDTVVKIVDGIVVSVPKNVQISYKKERVIEAQHFDALYYLGHLLSQEVIELSFAEDGDVRIEHHYTQEDTLIAYRLVINTAPNISLKINESFSGKQAKKSLILYGYDMHIARDARVEIVKDETLYMGEYIPIYSHFFLLEEHSSTKVFSFDFGDAAGLNLFAAKLNANAEFEANHLLFARGNAKRGTVSQIIHAEQNTRSSQKGKNILEGSARGIFDALIKIEQKGKGTKAYQNSQAVLLNSGAYMVSKPQLEIYIDDVEASHGSTIGELDDAQLFYLRSRGISLQEARKMLILAFANELIDAISEKNVREQLHNSFENAYYGASQLECIATCHNCSDTVLGEQR